MVHNKNIEMLHLMGKSHNLFDIGPTRKAIVEVLQIAGIHCGTIPEVSCPVKELLDLSIDHAEVIISKIKSKNKISLSSLKPEKIIMGSPEAYLTFINDNIYETITPLPSELLTIFKEKNEFSSIKKTIAIHPACSLETDPFYESTKDLLSLIPGVKIITLQSSCDHNRFMTINAHQKESVNLLIQEAEKQGADIIICTSPYCLSHLLMNHREGSWSTSNIVISDIYQLLLSSLNGGLI